MSSGTTYYLRVTVEDEAGNSKVSDVVEPETLKVYTWEKWSTTLLAVASPTLVSSNVNLDMFYFGTWCATTPCGTVCGCYGMSAWVSETIAVCNVNGSALVVFPQNNLSLKNASYDCGCNVVRLVFAY